MAAASPRLLLFAATLVVLYVAYKAAHNVYTTQQRKQERARVAQNDKRTILVCMHCTNQYACASSMAWMLRSALHPQHLRFAVVYQAIPSSVDVFDLLARANQNAAYTVQEDQVRCLVLRRKAEAGALSYGEAMERCLASLFDNETFVLFTSPGAVFCKNFDHVLKEHHASGCALTCHGPTFTDTSFRHPPGTHRTMRNYMAATMPSALLDVSKEVFFVGWNADGGLLRFACPSVQTTSLVSVALSSLCTFVSNEDVHAQRPRFSRETTAAVALSSALFGLKFVVPPATVVYAGKQQNTRPKHAPTTFPPELFIGYGRAMLGLSETFDRNEVLRKYGSLVNLEKQKVKLNIVEDG